MSDFEAFDAWWIAIDPDVRKRMNHSDALYGWVSAINYIKRKQADDREISDDNAEG